jgi:hypothetical protein
VKQKLRGGTKKRLFIELGELSGDRERSGRSKEMDGLERFFDPMRGFIADRGSQVEKEVGESGLEFALFFRKEANELKREGGKSGKHESEESGTRAGKSRKGDLFLTAAHDELVAWVSNEGGAGIRNEGDCFSLSEVIDHLIKRFFLIEAVKAFQGFVDAVMLKEGAAMTGILTEDIVAALKRLYSAEGEVAEVSDRCRN